MSSLAKTSYITPEEAQGYFDSRLYTEAWAAATYRDKQKALIQASTQIDRINYVGQKLNYQQEHEFPRAFTMPALEQDQYDTDLVPFGIKYAVCEQALALLDGFDPDAEIDGQAVVGSAYGQVQLQFDRDISLIHQKLGLCAQAYQNLIPFMRDPRSIVLSRI